MPLKDFITGKTNRIVVGATTGVGLILITSAALFSSKPLPVLKVENPNTGASLFEVSDHGAIGVNGSFGSAGECLKSGGSSGSVMAFGSCGGGTGGSSPEVGTSSFSGATLRLSDARYVQKQGDTMTGSLNVRATLSGQTLIITGNGSFTGKLVVAKSISGAALEVLGTASGQNVYATSSVTGSHLYAVTTFAGAGLASCSNATTSKLLYNSATKQFSCGTDTAPTYTAGQGLTITNSSLSLSARHSGSIILASTTLASSGTIIAEGSMSGQNLFSAISVTGTHLYAVRTLNGAGLGDCDTAGTSKLLWSVETKRFSCGTDTDTNTTYTAGNLLTLVGTQFRVKSILTGTTLQASSMLASSGAITWEGLGSGNNLHISGTLSASGRIVTDGTMSGFVVRYGSISPQVKQAMIYASGSTIAVGSGRYLYVVPRTMSGYKLGEVHVKVQTAGTTNTSTFRFRNVTKNNRHLLTVPVSIDSGELGSDTAATAYTIAPNPDVGAYDTLSFDIATVSTTAPKGLMFTFMFYKP